MVHVRISCHADLQALQDRSDGRMLIKLLSLESVRIASDSYALLRNLIERRYWRCPQIDLLSLLAGVAVELHKIKHDLFPILVQEAKLGEGFVQEASFVQKAKLGEGFPEALLLLKNSAMALVRLGEDAKEIVKKCVGSLVDYGFLGKVGFVGGVLKDNVDQVLKAAVVLLLLHAHLRRQGGPAASPTGCASQIPAPTTGDLLLHGVAVGDLGLGLSITRRSPIASARRTTSPGAGFLRREQPQTKLQSQHQE